MPGIFVSHSEFFPSRKSLPFSWLLKSAQKKINFVRIPCIPVRNGKGFKLEHYVSVTLFLMCFHNTDKQIVNV